MILIVPVTRPLGVSRNRPRYFSLGWGSSSSCLRQTQIDCYPRKRERRMTMSSITVTLTSTRSDFWLTDPDPRRWGGRYGLVVNMRPSVHLSLVPGKERRRMVTSVLRQLRRSLTPPTRPPDGQTLTPTTRMGETIVSEVRIRTHTFPALGRTWGLLRR